MSNVRRLVPRREIGKSERQRVWEAFCSDAALIAAYGITGEEMLGLRQAALMGNICSKQDFILMLRVIRNRRGLSHLR